MSGYAPAPAFEAATSPTLIVIASPTAAKSIIVAVQSYGLRVSLGGVSDVTWANSWCHSAAEYVELHEHRLYSMSVDFSSGTATFYRDGLYFSKAENPIWASPPTLGVKLSTSRAAYSGTVGGELLGNSEDYRVYRRSLSAAEHRALYWGRGADGLFQGLALRYTFTGRRVNNSGVNSAYRNIGGVPTGSVDTWTNAVPWLPSAAVHRPPRRR